MQTPPDFLIDPIGYFQFYLDIVGPYVIVAITLIIVVIIYKISIRVASKSLEAAGMGTEIASGLILVLRLIFFIIAVGVVIAGLNPDLAAILSVTAIFGTALGLAFSQALSNIVSGLYVFAARPFRVGDYVRIGGMEGIVEEITLNYTRILLPDETTQLVPNNKVQSTEVTNFRINLREFIRKEEKATKEVDNQSYRDSLEHAWKQLQKITNQEEAYRYTFDLSFHMGKKHNELIASFEKAFDKWESIFLSRPTYSLWAKPSAGYTYRFAFIVQDPMVIIKRTSEFMEELLTEYWEMR
ncbi:MAG: mechanosensitive ion channel [Candidatus Lokiarchaeota archaeon]|nr:mechanosensitive ion channel [Candidatus Lokiarchaeota archaeon]